MAVKYDLFLYADDTCLVFQSKNVKDIEKQFWKNKFIVTMSNSHKKFRLSLAPKRELFPVH